MQKTENINIEAFRSVPTPKEIHERHPLEDTHAGTVLQGRREIEAILDGKDPRLFAVVGPCSIHDPVAAMDYARRLKELADEVKDVFVLVMRAYFEKPRTTVGWKGFINDPDLDDSFHIEKGLEAARGLLVDITGLGLPAATEALDPFSPQYTADLISWYAIGARTTESQTHREMASGLSAPVGFKNSTDGSVQVAINAMMSARESHHFLGISEGGQTAVFQTRGNPYGHLILRGGGGRPNYDSVSIRITENALAAAGLNSSCVVDCSHANSNKDHELQPLVLEDCVNQILTGNTSICGFMIESHLKPGNQKLGSDPGQLEYGVSVTDACIGWDSTREILMRARDRLAPVLDRRGRD